MILRTYTDTKDNKKIGFAWTAKKETNEVLKLESEKIKKYFETVRDGNPSLEEFEKCTANCNEELLKGITYQTDSETALKRLNNNVNGATQSFKGLRSIGKSLLSGLANFGAAMLIETALSVVINAILKCKDNAEALSKVLKDEQKSYYNTIVANGSETWDNAMKNIAADSGETYNNQLEAIEKTRTAISKAQSFKRLLKQ